VTALIHTDGHVLVHAPGHLYSPLPLQVKPPKEQAKPGELEANEKRFVADLVRFLAPAELNCNEADDPIPKPILRDGVEYVLVRNIDQFPSAFRIRMPGDAHWFYPDFLLWITDRRTTPATQTLCLIDPKGILQDMRDGWSDSKLLSLLYRLRLVEQQCAPDGTVTLPSGEIMRFRARGAIVSISSFLSLANSKAQFALAADRPSVSKRTFEKAGIFFIDDEGYMERLHDYLRADDDWLLSWMGELALRAATPMGQWFAEKMTSGETRWIGEVLKAILPADGEPPTRKAALANLNRLPDWQGTEVG
jgi:hypothetical protein